MEMIIIIAHFYLFVHRFVLSVSFTVGGNVSSDVSASLFLFICGCIPLPVLREPQEVKRFTFEIHN